MNADFQNVRYLCRALQLGPADICAGPAPWGDASDLFEGLADLERGVNDALEKKPQTVVQGKAGASYLVEYLTEDRVKLTQVDGGGVSVYI